MKSVTLKSPTIVLITDRTDLDDQLSRTFTNAKQFIGDESVISVESREQLRELLKGRNSGGVFLTTIHKFTEDTELLTDRSNVICISDEAHRSQINLDQKVKITEEGVKRTFGFAKYLHDSLPNATYVGFTGTPIDATLDVFGDVIDSYTMTESVADEITVRIVYEGRAAKVLLDNSKLKEIEDYYAQCADEGASSYAIDASKRANLQMNSILGDPDRLKSLAADFVDHYEARIAEGSTVAEKALFVSSSRTIAYAFYKEVIALRPEWAEVRVCADGEKLSEQEQKEIMPMERLKMVMTRGKDDEKPLYDLLGTKEYRKELDKQFKKTKTNFKIAIVVDMWLTGFDAPTISTMYLDKPMKDHTLMQTIARANRVTGVKIDGKSKRVGELVDYYNVFRNMKAALKDYGQGSDGGEMPVQNKSVLFDLLDQAIEESTGFLAERGIDVSSLLDGEDRIFKNIAVFKTWADILLGNEEWRKSFYVYENTISSLYDACRPEILGRPVVKKVAVFQYLRGIVDAIIDQQDIDEVTRKIGELLDESLVVDETDPLRTREHQPEYKIVQTGKVWDLSKINFESLKKEFKETEYKNIEITDLLAFIQKKLAELMNRNVTRRDFAERLAEIVDRYNSGASSNENYFDELLQFTRDLKDEDGRHIREGLTEEELEIFDLLSKQSMTKGEEQKVKLAAKKLLHRVLEEHPRVLVQDWFKDAQTRKIVRSAVEAVLDSELPETYDKDLFNLKCQSVFDTILDYAIQGVKFAA